MTPQTFQFVAVDRSGVERRGVTTAPTRQDAYRKVAATGVTPLKLRLVKEKKTRRRRRRVSPRDIAHLTYQLTVLLEAQIPIADGFRSIAEQEHNERLRKMILDIAQSIQSGRSITESFTPHRRVFGDVYIETLRAAERSGNLVKILTHLAEMLERQMEATQQLRQALTYPIVVLVALGGATLFLIANVVPKFAKMFADRGVELPLLTQWLQAVGVSLRDLWWLYGLCVATLVVMVRWTWASPQGRTVIDRYLHYVPYLRQLLVGAAVGRFARVFGISLSSGLGLIESLEMSGRASGRPLLMKDAATMVEQVRQGGKLSDVLRACGYLPGFAKRMIAAGEESAELTRMCNIVARHYDREVSHLTKNAATVVEPVLIALLTGVVLMVALAVFLPMWDMVSLVK